MSTYETGHARNIQNFETLISFVTAYGATYNPANTAIELTALGTKLTAAKTAMAGVAATLSASKLAINDREETFASLRKLSTRIVNAYDAGGATPADVADARTINRKIAGTRKKPIPETDPDAPSGDTPNYNSASQQSFTQLVAHFDDLLKLVTDSGTYSPNETDLDIVQLSAYSANLKSANTAVINAYTPLSNARIARDSAMYGDGTGIVELAASVKKYVKSVYGAGSPEFKQISGLAFRRPKG
jgi:hypothetical protein